MLGVLLQKGNYVGVVPTVGWSENCCLKTPGAPGSSVVQTFYKRCSILNRQRNKECQVLCEGRTLYKLYSLERVWSGKITLSLVIISLLSQLPDFGLYSISTLSKSKRHVCKCECMFQPYLGTSIAQFAMLQTSYVWEDKGISVIVNKTF